MSDAHIIVDPGLTIGEIRPEVYGSFVEHLGRAVHTGVYEPDHPSADERGFRRDVIALVKELGVSTVRYPGGNFVSGFQWEDSVGPVDRRPRRLDLAWHSTETNEIGLHEFADWLDEVGSELMLAVNLGTRGVREALELLEYANLPAEVDTALTRRRRENGRAAPFGVGIWCLGNEMDGPWQLGHRSADDYGKLAAETARAMRQLDPDVRLVVCGSSSSAMPTFSDWERTVLTHTYDLVDFISCHAYWEERNGDLASFLASAVDMDRMIESVVATADAVGAALRNPKRIQISFDEWNVWYNDRFEQVDKIQGLDNWPVAPRLLEDVYTAADAVVVGSLLISLLNHADRVTAASLAQLVNVIAPIMTEPGGAAWRQTTFFPFAETSRLGRGEALRLSTRSARTTTTLYGEVDVVTSAATRNGSTSALFVVNRDQRHETEVSVDLSRLAAQRLVGCRSLTHPDPHATNTAEHPDRVGMRPNTSARLDGVTLRLTLPPVSWTVIELDDESAG